MVDMTDLWQDVRYGSRALLRQPGFSAVAVVTLALGIGASTALFSVIDAAVIRPLPYPHSEQLALVWTEEKAAAGTIRVGPSLEESRQLRDQTRLVRQVCVWHSTSPTLVDAGELERVPAESWSEGCLATYGLPPALGRSFTIDDTRPGAPGVAMLGYAYWQRRFGGTPDIIGRRLTLQDYRVTVIGVLPQALERGISLVMPLRYETAEMNHLRGMGSDTLVRLSDGVTPLQAAAALSGDTRIVVQSLYDATTRGYGTTLRTLAESVILILLLGCVNVAGLLLARGKARQAELSVRASLGASRGRLIRQLLTESLLLAGVGGVAGILLATVSLDGLVAIIPLSLPGDAPATIDASVLAFSAGAALVSAVLFGLVPALRLSRTAAPSLAWAGRGSGSTLSRRHGQVLIAVEVAIAMVLLVGAGVMIRSFARLISSDLGFDPERLASIDVAPLDRNPDIFKAYYPALLHGIRAMPAVAHASAIDDLPLVGGSSFTIVRSGSARGGLACAQILPDYFETLDIPLRAGRLPADADFRAGRPVAVLSQDAATMLFGDQQALGRELTLGSDHTFQVIGIVGNVYHGGADWQREPKVYVLYGQMPPRALSLVVRLRPGAAVTGDQLRSAANAVGPKVFVNKISTGEEWLGTNTMTVRHRTQLFALLGVLGLVLALVGIFSVTAYAVVNRTREIGVRVALGARTNQVVGGILRDAVWPVALGAAAGVAGATAATRVIATFLFKTTPNDPLTLATAGLLLVAAGCLAAWLPARRAALVDPVTALRAD